MDCSIVVAAYAECALSEHLALSESSLCAVSVKDVEEHLVLSLARNDHHVVEVLCAGADERDAAYIDLLDDVGLRSAACYGLLERIEVNDNEVDFRDGVFCHLLAVAFVVAASEDATEDAWVQSLNTSAED